MFQLEKEVERLARRTQKELVLLHKEGGGKPHNTVAWLNMRSWIRSHHHIVCPKRVFSRKSLYRIVGINTCFLYVLMKFLTFRMTCT